MAGKLPASNLPRRMAPTLTAVPFFPLTSCGGDSVMNELPSMNMDGHEGKKKR
jgi:hypothetical protein